MRADSVSPQASWPEHDHDADAGGGADGPQRQRGVGRREVGRADPRAAVAADEERLWRARRRGPVGDVEQRRAPVDLDHAGVLHRARDRDQRRARVLHQPVGPEGVGAGAGDHGDVGQRLGVVHQRPPAPDAQRDSLVGTERRQGLTRLDPADQGGLLAGDEAVGRAHQDLGDRANSPPPRARPWPAPRPPRRGRGPRARTRVTRRAPLAAARSWAPSSTRWGERIRRSLSLSLAGSPSMPLTTMVPPLPAAWATASLMAAGNPAPPRPARPEDSSTETKASRQPRAPGDGQRDRAQGGDVTGQVGRVAQEPVAAGRGEGLAHARHGVTLLGRAGQRQVLGRHSGDRRVRRPGRGLTGDAAAARPARPPRRRRTPPPAR